MNKTKKNFFDHSLKMNKTKNLFLIMIVIAALLLSGCGNQTSITKNPYIGGTEGLTMEFQEGQPPMEIFDQGTMPFAVGLMLKNKGEHGVFDETYEPNDDFEDFGRLTLRGIKASSYGLTTDETIIDFEAEGITLMPYKKNPADGTELQGGIASTQFPTLTYMHDAQGNTELTLGVEMCYNYKTKSSTNICVIADVQSKKKICEPYGVKETSNSAAPVHVISIGQTAIGNGKLSLTINIARVNEEGTVFRKINPDLITNNDKVCDDSPASQEKDKVYVIVELPEGGEEIQCAEFGGNNEGYISINSGGQPRPITCTLESDDATQDYVTALYVDLEYSFGQFIDKTIIIKDY